ncbi:sin3 histone deacetylase corepressor complex component SDS3 [Coccinella septempunctata]|uniref:sin3 histone deacetylase corepressor complex component SDS3 n=1 Tax=Coccinella septempunctata TaxID=41139 RepID=UPI001D080878|nr:sin3 histone deacetylase corepressor complex component SDS3 [Coccinella septempunctata]
MNHSPVEFDFDDYKYEDDEDRENNKPEESDEDTEDASETDIGHNEGPVEIKEQMYQDKLAGLKKKLQQLKDGTHFELNQKIQLLKEEFLERLQMNKLHRDYLLECIEKEYVQEKKAAVKEFEEKKIDLKENLISDLEDKKRTIETERFSWELTGDPMEVKPVMTRKLRRRPNDPVPVPEKRRKIQTTQITHLLDEKEIEHDLRIISRGKLLTPTRKRSDSVSDAALVQNPSVPVHSSMPFHDISMGETKETRIEEGKLLYERRWFHRGQSVFVESKDMSKFPANISAIGSDAIWVKKSDGSKVKIYLTNLARGKISLKRRAS